MRQYPTGSTSLTYSGNINKLSSFPQNSFIQYLPRKRNMRSFKGDKKKRCQPFKFAFSTKHIFRGL